ncbi:MAG: hypothetical protein KKH25_05095 [Candidatus Omnitrophica bacterium]|nr:hypothetical protein [Candidatus Omnitrophota bacterium]
MQKRGNAPILLTIARLPAKAPRPKIKYNTLRFWEITALLITSATPSSIKKIIAAFDLTISGLSLDQ